MTRKKGTYKKRRKDEEFTTEYKRRTRADTDEYRRQNDTRSVKKTLSIPSLLNHG